MNWDLLWAEPQPIPWHAVLALAAVVLGGLQFALPKGTFMHRCLGWLWVTLMAAVALSGFWIHTIRLWGLFSPIHLLSILTLGTLFFSLRDARNGNIRRHRLAMIMLYLSGLLLAGLFTLLPGRIMHGVLFAAG